MTGRPGADQPARRSPRITGADVFAAADVVLKRGDKPTVERVLKTLGRGSANTVNKYLHVYWQTLYSRLRDGDSMKRAQARLMRRLDEVLGDEN